MISDAGFDSIDDRQFGVQNKATTRHHWQSWEDVLSCLPWQQWSETLRDIKLDFDEVMQWAAAAGGPNMDLYLPFHAGFAFLNREFFSSSLLPPLMYVDWSQPSEFCLLPYDRLDRTGQAVHDMAIAPGRLARNSSRRNLMLLLHEMTHQHQHSRGAAGRRRYHNQGFAQLTEQFGLQPFTPMGKIRGETLDANIIPGGRFDRVVSELLASGYVLP